SGAKENPARAAAIAARIKIAARKRSTRAPQVTRVPSADLPRAIWGVGTTCNPAFEGSRDSEAVPHGPGLATKGETRWLGLVEPQGTALNTSTTGYRSSIGPLIATPRRDRRRFEKSHREHERSGQ